MLALWSLRVGMVLAFALPVLATAQSSVEPSPDALAALSFEDLMQVRIETVYGASKYEQKVTRAPASVTILSAEDMARFGHRTLAEALRSIRGLYVSDDRNYSYLGVRGFLRPGDYNSRVLVLIDGHRMNDNIYDGAYFAREGLLAVDVIERIEFVRGPSSSIYGSSAFFGIVNVVTKHGKELGGPEIAVGGGSLGEVDGRFSYGAVLENQVEVTLNASYYTRQGHDKLYFPEFDPALSDEPRAANGGIANTRDSEESFGMMGSVSRGDLTLSASVLSRSKNVPTASFGTLFDTPERTEDERSYLELKYSHAFAPDLQLLGRMSYDRFGYSGWYVYDYAAPGDAPDITLSRDAALGTWLNTEWQVTKHLWDRHTLLAGVEYRHSLDQQQSNYDDTDPRLYYVDDDRQTRNGAVFVQGEFTLTPQLLLNTGVRYDYYYGSFGGTVNPRVGLIFSPSQRTTLKLLYGDAFRAPSAYERFYYVASGDGSLEPETIRTYELVLERYAGQRDRFNVSLYRYTVEELITQLASDAGDIYFDNLARVTANGIELEWERKYEGGALARVSYAFQRTEDAATGRTLTSSPRHLAKINFGLPLGRRVKAGLEVQYHGVAETLAGNRAEDFLLANLSASTELRPRLQIRAGIYNLFDTSFAYPGAEDHLQDKIEQDGRTFRVDLTHRF
jgi:outer membrane receptor for ferrienterochelin and colicins